MVERGLRIAAGVRELAIVRRLSVSIAVVDRTGELVSMDPMEGAPSGSPLVAQALAAASALYGLGSGDPDTLALVRDTAHLMPVPVAAVRGGMPLNWEGRTYAGVGVAGGTPEVCHRILTSVMLSVS
jgi:glc operon protein GlcG